MSATHVNSRSPIVLCCTAAMAAALSTAYAAEPGPPAPNPADPVDYVAWIDRISEVGTQDSAFEVYEKVVEKYTPLNGDWGSSLDGPWTQNAPVARFIEANREAFELFRASSLRGKYARAATTEPSEDPRLSRMLITTLLPDYRPHRGVVRGLIAEGYRAWAGGDQTLLIKNAGTVLRSARHLFTGATLIERLVGTAEAAVAYSAILKALELSDDPHALAKQLRENFKKMDREFPPFGHAILFERLASWDVCQRLFVPGRKPGRWDLHEPCVELLREAMGAKISRKDSAAIGRMGFDKTVREINEYYDAFEQWVNTPFHLTSGPEGKEKEHFERFMHIPEQSKSPLLPILLRSLTRAREIDEQISATRSATHLIVMLFLHRAEHGKFPQTLDELTADGVSGVRVDPFSGKDFVYKRKRRGKSFELYSVSLNLKDDAGRHVPWSVEGDYVFWPVQK